MIVNEVPQPDNNLKHVALKPIFGLAQNLNNIVAQVLEPGTLSIINGEIRTGTNGLLRPPPRGTASNDGRHRIGTKDGNSNTELRFSCWTMAPYVFKPKVVGGVNIVAVQHPFSGSFVHIFLHDCISMFRVGITSSGS